MTTLIELPPPVQALQLRPYQQEALEAIEGAAQRQQRRQLVALPTGTGKTVIFCELIRRQSGRCLVLVHREELIQQTIEKLELIAPDLDVGIIKAARDEHGAPAVVASIQTLSREARLQRVVADFDLIIVDEAHHATADSYRRVLDHLGDTALVIGFTATPYRGDGESLTEIFPEIVYQGLLLDMMQQEYLSDLRALRVTLDVDFNALHTRAGDFIERECTDLLRAGNAATLVAQAYRTHAPERRGLLFTTTVDLAEDFAAALVAQGIVAECVNGDTPSSIRRKLLQRFRAGAVQVITNCGVLTEGYDEPSVDCIVVARPTKSKPLYVQMIGRGTRKFPGKSDCLILDVAGATERHDLMALSSVFDLPPTKLRNGEKVTEATVDYQRACELVQAHDADAARVVAQRVDLFQARPLNWVVVGATHFVLAVGMKGMIHVRPHEAGWQASLHRPDGRHESLLERPDMNYTIGWAEDFARRLGVDSLLSRDAPWRHGMATDKQRAALRKLRIQAPSDLSRGDASDLIAQNVARRSSW